MEDSLLIRENRCLNVIRRNADVKACVLSLSCMGIGHGRAGGAGMQVSLGPEKVCYYLVEMELSSYISVGGRLLWGSSSLHVCCAGHIGTSRVHGTRQVRGWGGPVFDFKRLTSPGLRVAHIEPWIKKWFGIITRNICGMLTKKKITLRWYDGKFPNRVLWRRKPMNEA